MSSRRLLRATESVAAPVHVPLREVRHEPRHLGAGPLAVMAAARAEADALLAAAEAQRASAHAVGYAHGLAEARAEARGEVEAALMAVAELVDAVDRRRAEMEDEAARAAAALALEVAAKVVRAEVAARPERIIDVIRAAMRRAFDRDRLVVRVNPSDLAICRESAPELLTRTGGIGTLDFFDDQRIPPGSCVLETSSGDIDATFESQFSRIQEALFAPPDHDLM